jgi:hypothetical protein
MSKKMRALVEIEVTLTDAEWEQIQTDYAENWREEIEAGDAEKEPLSGDVWNAIVADGEPNDFEINWDAFTDEEIVDEE